MEVDSSIVKSDDDKGNSNSQSSTIQLKKHGYYTCAIANCPNPQNVRYTRFPNKNQKALQDKWVALCKRADKFNPDSARICERHFSPSMVKRDIKHEFLHLPLRFFLNPGAYPDQNLPKNVESFEQLAPILPSESSAVLATLQTPDPDKEKNYNQSCAVISCKNPNGISYHVFPKDPEVSKIWVSRCGRPSNFNVKRRKVCSSHFLENDYENDGLRGKVLKKSAIPSLKVKVGEDTIDVNDVGNDGPSNVIESIDLTYDDGVVTNEADIRSERSKRKVKKDHSRMANDVLLAEAKEKTEILENVIGGLQRENRELKEQHERDETEKKRLEEKQYSFRDGTQKSESSKRQVEKSGRKVKSHQKERS